MAISDVELLERISDFLSRLPDDNQAIAKLKPVRCVHLRKPEGGWEILKFQTLSGFFAAVEKVRALPRKRYIDAFPGHEDDSKRTRRPR